LEYLTHNKEAEVTNEESEQEEQNNLNQNGGDTK
jgi:hypothetical protein